jgi:hypothetical protein
MVHVWPFQLRQVEDRSARKRGLHALIERLPPAAASVSGNRERVGRKAL